MVALMLAALATHIAGWFMLEGEAWGLAVMYLSITAIAVPLQTLLNIGTACHRGAGDALRPLMVMVVVNVLNVALSFALSGVDLAVAATNADGEMSTRAGRLRGTSRRSCPTIARSRPPSEGPRSTSQRATSSRSFSRVGSPDTRTPIRSTYTGRCG